MEFSVDMTEQFLRNILNWYELVTSIETLKEAGNKAYESIRKDIGLINQKIVEMRMGEFCNIQKGILCSKNRDYEHLYFFSFQKHWTYVFTNKDFSDGKIMRDKQAGIHVANAHAMRVITPTFVVMSNVNICL